MLNDKKNPRAILHTLLQCYTNKPEKPWGYCNNIMKLENLNYNERDHTRASS